MRKASWIFLAFGLIAAVGHPWLPGEVAPSLAWDTIGAVATVALAIGIHRNRPSNMKAWWIFTIGIALFVCGDFTWDIAIYCFGHSNDSVPASDILYLSAYPLLTYALFTMSGLRGRGRAVMVDGAVVSLAAGAVLWEMCVAPTIDSASGSTWDRLTTLAYPMMDVVLVVGVIYMVLTIGRWVPAAGLLVAGMACQLVGDSIYARLSAQGSLTSTHWLDPLWPASYVLLAAAALHPTMRLLGGRANNDRLGVARLRVALLGLALFAAPAVALLAESQGRNEDALGLGIVSAIVATLLIWRFDNLVRETNQAYRSVHHSEQRFRTLVQHASDVVTVVNGHACIKYISPAVLHLLGEPPASYLGTRVDENMHPDDVERAADTFARALAQPGRTFTFEARIRHSDGSWRWIETTCTNQLDEPAVRGVVGNLRDVTERKHIEALETGEARVLGLLARGAPLDESVSALIHTIEDLLGGRCSIRLVDPTTGRLSKAYAPNIPQGYLDVLETVALTPVSLAASGDLMSFASSDDVLGDGSADDARRSIVVHDDVALHSLWPEVSAAAAEYGLHHSWTLHVCAAEGGQILATFTIYWPDSAKPGPAEQSLLERWSHLAAIAIDHSRSQERLGFLAMHDPLTGRTAPSSSTASHTR